MHGGHAEGTMRFALATIVTDNFDDMGDFYAKVLQKKPDIYRGNYAEYTLPGAKLALWREAEAREFHGSSLHTLGTPDHLS